MLLFAAKPLADIARGLITSLLYDAAKFGLSETTASSLEDIYYQALRDCTKPLKKGKAKALRETFKTSKVSEKIIAFQQYGELIPDEFFAEMFKPIIGETHAKLLVKELFASFRQLVARKETLAREIQLLSSDILLVHFQKQDIETRKQLQEILDAIKKQSNIEATIGYQEIPQLPPDFVAPDAALSKIKAHWETNNVILIHGAPGSGKSVIATALAREAEESKYSVLDRIDVKKINDVELSYQTAYDRGNLHWRTADWELALHDFSFCLQMESQREHHHHVFNSLGLVYKDKGEWDKAIEFYNKSLEDKQKVGDIHGMAQTYGNLSLLYFEQKKYPEAISLHLEIFLLFVKLGATPEIQQASRILGSFQKRMGEEGFNKIANETLNRIFDKGITWGRHLVVSREEAQALREKMQKERIS